MKPNVHLHSRVATTRHYEISRVMAISLSLGPVVAAEQAVLARRLGLATWTELLDAGVTPFQVRTAVTHGR